MSSTNKFPSGLNNWLDSDKPERLDFVTDNEIIDETALWKGDYDASGVVEQAGGIDAYALAKADYDPAGNVAAAGGIANAIQTAVSANEGFTDYTHSKNGTVHSLVNPVGGNVIRFVATADFVKGDTFVVNGTACTATMTDGDTLYDESFIEGAVVTCLKNGNALIFQFSNRRKQNSLIWTQATLQNSFNHTSVPLQYVKTVDGWVMVNGAVTKSSIPASTMVIATLPVGYRPNKDIITVMSQSGTGLSTVIYIRTSGEIQFSSSTTPTGWGTGQTSAINAIFKVVD